MSIKVLGYLGQFPPSVAKAIEATAEFLESCDDFNRAPNDLNLVQKMQRRIHDVREYANDCVERAGFFAMPYDAAKEYLVERRHNRTIAATMRRVARERKQQLAEIAAAPVTIAA